MVSLQILMSPVVDLMRFWPPNCTHTCCHCFPVSGVVSILKYYLSWGLSAVEIQITNTWYTCLSRHTLELIYRPIRDKLSIVLYGQTPLCYLKCHGVLANKNYLYKVHTYYKWLKTEYNVKPIHHLRVLPTWLEIISWFLCAYINTF